MKLFFPPLLLLAALLLRFTDAFAQQEVRTLILHENVGEEIDAAEKAKYRLFPFYPAATFRSARFVQLSDSTIILKAQMQDGQEQIKPYTKADFMATRNIISRSGGGRTPKPNPEAEEGKNKGAEAEKAMMVELKDGTVLFGKIIRSDAKQIDLDTDNLGVVTIETEKIKQMTEVQAAKTKGGEYWFPNPHTTRMFFGPTAFQLRKGEGYLQSTYIFLLSANLGLTDNITMGGGLTLLPGVPLSDQLFFLSPKIGGKLSEKVRLSGGLFYINVVSESAGVAYGVVTLGSADANFTTGLGYGFVNDEFGKNPAIMLGGLKRFSKRLALVSENYIFIVSEGINERNEVHPLGSLGLRFMSQKLSADLAMVKILSVGEAPALPFVSFAFKF